MTLVHLRYRCDTSIIKRYYSNSRHTIHLKAAVDYHEYLSFKPVLPEMNASFTCH